MDVTNRTVFIAGATSGIGLELARRFAAAGSTVIVGGRRTGLLDQIGAEGFATVPIDVTDQGSIDRARLLRGAARAIGTHSPTPARWGWPTSPPT